MSLTPETFVRIFGYDADLEDLRVGMHVDIEAERMMDGSLSALVIEVEDDFELIELDGVIVELSETDLILLARHGEIVTVGITPDTVVMWKGRIIAAGDLEAGDQAEVKAIRDAVGSIVALRVKLENEEDDLDELEGIIASVEGSLLTLALHDGTSVTILIGESTVIRVDGEAGSVSELRSGREVEVHLVANPDGSLSAIAIKVETAHDDDEVELHGLVVALRSDAMTIQTLHFGEATFRSTDATLVRHGHDSIAFSEVRIGDEVEVEGIAEGDGSLIALKIDVEHGD